MARFGRLCGAGLLVVSLLIIPTPTASAVTPVAAVDDAVGYAANRSVTEFISVVDRGNGAVLASTGNANSQVASESIMKLLLASYYLVLYGGYTATPDSVKDRLSYMLRYSDDNTASSLFSANAIPTIAARYGLGNTSNATDRVGHWGAARITAADMTKFLYQASIDNQVGPWLLPVMAQTAPNGSDGFDQHFGLNALDGIHGSKQGWGCDSYFTSPTCAIHSVGYTDKTFVAVLQLAAAYPDPMRETATYAARVIQQSTVKPDPVGSLDAIANPDQNLLTVAGWAADPAAPGRREEVHVYVTGPAGTSGQPGIFTTGSRPDVAAAYPWAGGSTGFWTTVRPQGAGVNTVCAYAINVDPPNSNPQIGCQSILVQNTFGYLDAVSAGPGQLSAAGWAANPNNPGERVEIHIYDTGPAGTKGYPGFRAGNDRPDVSWALPGYGAAHGFRATIPVTEPGQHNICAFAITTGGGTSNSLLGCSTVQVSNAFGSFDLAGVSGSSIVAAGWALNPNNPAEQVQLHVYDSSRSGTRRYTNLRADTPRSDIAAAFPGYGGNHGFWASIPSVEKGAHQVCVYAITTGGGTGNPLLGCRNVTVT